MERGSWSWQWEGGGFWLEVPDSQYEEKRKDGGRDYRAGRVPKATKRPLGEETYIPKRVKPAFKTQLLSWVAGHQHAY